MREYVSPEEMDKLSYCIVNLDVMKTVHIHIPIRKKLRSVFWLDELCDTFCLDNFQLS